MDFFHTEYPLHDPARTYSLDDGEFADRPSNGDNARTARASILEGDSYESEECFSDLMPNLLHLAHSKELDVCGIVTAALSNFHDEAGKPDDMTLEP